MKNLVCGPYVGEFGWELFFWSGYCRALSRHFEKTTVITRPGREFLYRDFAVVDHFEPPSQGINDCQTNSEVTIEDMKEITQPYISPTTFWLQPFENHHGAYQPHWSQRLYIPALNGALIPEYISRPRSPEIEQKIILLHARNRTDIRPEDNPPLGLFNELSHRLQSEGYRVMSIGAEEDSHFVDQSIDKRNISLERLAYLMDTAVCVIGTTSGPLHFASLMGCPVITWQWDIDKMWHRFSASWNPLNTKVVYINTRKENDVHFHPIPDLIMWSVNRIQDKNFKKLQIENER